MATLKCTSFGLLLLATPVLAGSSEPGAASEPATETRETAKADNSSEVAKEATPSERSAKSAWSPSSGARGTLGVHRVEAAHPLAAGEIVLTLAASYSAADSFLVTGDSNKRQRQQIAIVWAIPWVEGLELHLNQNSTTNSNSAFEPQTTQILGDPELAVKYSRLVTGTIGVGGVVAFMVPTSPGGTGLKPDAFKLSFLGAGTMAIMPWLEASLNLGIVIDQTGSLFRRQIDAARQFSAGVANSSWLFVTGLGVATNFNLGDIVGLGPFAEFTMGIGDTASFSENPMIASLGAKVYPARDGLLELSVGVDIAASGAPCAAAPCALPGVPPWELFGRITAHLVAIKEAATTATTGVVSAACSDDGDCKEGMTCIEGTCGVIREVIKTEIQEVVKAAPTWRVEGTVMDKASGEPVPGATITVSGVDTSAIASDPKTGKFLTYPLPTGEGILQLKIEAPGYLAGESTMPKGAANEVKSVAVVLQQLGKDLKGEIKGSLKDSRSGDTVKGQVFIPALGKKIKVSKEGTFSEEVKAGRYQVLISSRGYVTQKKEIEIRPGDVVILNVDLNPKRR